jgi:hypothetical protein
LPRLRNEIKSNDELAGVSLIDLKNEYKKLKTKYDKINSGFFCHDCNRFLPADKFYVSSKWKSGVIPTCRECLNKIALGFNEKAEKTNETEETFKEALRIAKLPFLRKEYNSAVATLQDTTNGARRISTFQQYMGVIQSLPQYKDMRWEDGDFEAAEEVEEEKEIKLSKDKKKAAVKRFGTGYTDGAYLFLQNEYEDWIARYTIESKAQEVLLIEICKAELKLHEADINGEDTKDLIKSLQDLMGSLNIRPNQKDAKGIADAKSLGQMIEMWEEHDPIPEPDDDFKDVDRIGFLIDVFFKGHLAKMMGLKGAFSAMYEKFMDKYTVKKQVYKDGKTSEEMFEQIFGSAGDKDG